MNVNFPKLMTGNNSHTQEAQIASRIKVKKTIPGNIIFKLWKSEDEEKVMKETRDKNKNKTPYLYRKK